MNVFKKKKKKRTHNRHVRTQVKQLGSRGRTVAPRHLNAKSCALRGKSYRKKKRTKSHYEVGGNYEKGSLTLNVEMRNNESQFIKIRKCCLFVPVHKDN